VIPATQLPAGIEAQVQATIDRLKFNDYECLKLREAYARAYRDGDISQHFLRQRAPFLAREIERACNLAVV